MNAQLTKFFKMSGFKALALAKFNQCEYSLVLYVCNCAISGFNQIITTHFELSTLLNFTETEITEAINNLRQYKVITTKFFDKTKNTQDGSMRIGLQYDVSKWNLEHLTDSSLDATVFPFRLASGKAHLELKITPKTKFLANNNSTTGRIIKAFKHYHVALSAEGLEIAIMSAQNLQESHPVDSILILLHHFGTRIPTLSLLQSSWQHYQDLYEEESCRIDLLGARKKYEELDIQLREISKLTLDKSEDLELTEAEKTVLSILIKHRHPRRQLFWAYQARSRYENLAHFFEKYSHLMMKVTTS